VPLHVIEPCGFAFSPHAWRRSAMDYADLADLHRHDSWEAYLAERPPGRLIAMTTKGAGSLWDFRFEPGDTLLMGRESAGLPDEVHEAAQARLLIPMQPGARSLNVAMAAAIGVAEAGRQVSGAVDLCTGQCVFHPPFPQCRQNRCQRPATIGQRIFDLWRHLRIDLAPKQPIRFQLAQLIGQHPLGDVRQLPPQGVET
jgi:tRNA (cytidine/uridine-2'-O-)-methyltransferase